MNSRKQIVITRVMDKPAFFYMQGDDIYDVVLGKDDRQMTVSVGDIYVGRVQNIVQNIDAAFVEVKKDVLCYLPLSEYHDEKNTVKCGDELIVQIRKEAVRTKQAVITKFPDIVGQYVVITTKNSMKGISKKIGGSEEKTRLQNLLSEFAVEPYGIVLRTNAEDTDSDIIRCECRDLLDELHEIMTRGLSRKCFSLLRREKQFYIRQIYNYRPEEFDRIITDVPEVYDQLAPVYGEKAEFYEDISYPLDKLFGLAAKLTKALEKKVWLKSGGNLVIETTEALTVVDVNTGKAVDGKRNKETTFFKINCEAALEAARQIRLRGISGIIIIDFIDMKSRENQNKLLKLLREELKKDKIRTSLIDITKLGLVEITRMKKTKSLREILS